MLKKIIVGHGWHLYKTSTPVVPGEYYKAEIRKPSMELKKQLQMLAVEDANGRFAWICPFKPWVKMVTTGWIPEELACMGLSERVNWDVIGLSPDIFRPWQRKLISDAWNTVQAGYQFRRGVIVGLGGGKTLAGLSVGQMGESVVVAAPRHVHKTWKEQAEQWKFPQPVVTTYESLHKIQECDVLILDEVFAVKNPESIRSGKAKELSSKASIVLGLTGTPAGGGEALDWRWLDVVNPGCVPDNPASWQFLFGEDTCVKEVAPGRNAYVTTKWNTDKVAKIVDPHVFRVDTKHLLAYLPEIEYRRLTVPQPKDWSMVIAGAGTSGTSSKKVSQARMLSDGFIYNDRNDVIRLNEDKIKTIISFVENIGEPVVIYAAWSESVAALARAFQHKKPAVISGQTADMGMEQDRFTSRQTDILICNARFGSGINRLQERCRVEIFMSWSTSPTDREQAIGRLYRPGQKQGVIVVDVVAEGTLDERCLELISTRNDLSAEMVEKILLQELAK